MNNQVLVWREHAFERAIFVRGYRIVQKKNKCGYSDRWSVFEDVDGQYHSLYAFAIFYTLRHLELFLGVKLPQ